jgi:hypothetical protein
MVRKRQKKDKKREKEIAEAAYKVLAHETSTKGSTQKNPGLDPSSVGVDIGTSKIAFAKSQDNKLEFTAELNAFIEVKYSKFTEKILRQNQIKHYKADDTLVIYGDGAEGFANIMNAEMRRPMQQGLLNPKEVNAIEIIKGILDDIVGAPKRRGAQLCFSIPGIPEEASSDVIYHEAVLKRYLEEKGFHAKSINEGLAVVFSELEGENFSGIGISAGGGMCNVCLAFLSVPILSFSIRKGGDYIDDAVASVTGEVNTRIKMLKEKELDLTIKPSDDIEDALHIYYDDLILTLVRKLKEAIIQTAKLPDLGRPIPIVLSGGTAKPDGFAERFEMMIDKEDFPIDISEVRMAKDPLYATAKGALISASYQE